MTNTFAEIIAELDSTTTPHRPKADTLWRFKCLATITKVSLRLSETMPKVVEAAASDHGVKVSDLWAVKTLLESHLEDEDFNDLRSYLLEAEAFGEEAWFNEVCEAEKVNGKLRPKAAQRLRTHNPIQMSRSEARQAATSMTIQGLKASRRQMESVFEAAVLIEDEALNMDDFDFADYAVEHCGIKDWDEAVSLVWIAWGILEDREIRRAL